MLSVQGKEIAVTNITDHPSEEVQQEIFAIIDRLLSFEACLYHQILPLKLAENQLVLGMVNPQDSDALDYIHRFLDYLALEMLIENISAETHRTILSAYLNYKNQNPSNSALNDQLKTEISSVNITNISESRDNNKPEELDASDSIVESSPPTHYILKPLTINSANNKIVPVEIPVNFSSLAVLGTLPPKQILAELLGRILSSRIGRLYLERQPYEGKITWSENGVLQSGLEKLPLSVFQGVLNELKRFISLPRTPVTEPKQVEQEYTYKEKNLLLRWRVIDGNHGEEATVQVLQASALKSYHQEKLHRLNHETTASINNLKHCLHHIREILMTDSQLQPEQLAALSNIIQLTDNLDKQLKILIPSECLDKK